MKLNRKVSIAVLLFYMFGLIPFAGGFRRVQASESSGIFKFYNADSTAAYNKYGVKGTVEEDNIAQYDDSIIIVSSSGVYQIKNGVSKESLFADRSYSYKLSGRFENNIYLLAKKEGSNYYENKILVLNLDIGLFSWEDYGPTIKRNQVIDLIIDNQGNRFFCIEDIYTYVFVKIDKNKTLVATISTYLSKLSDISITKLKCDSSNNIWFASYIEGNDTRYHTDLSTTLYSIENTSILTKLNSYGGIRDYKIQDNGHIWYIPEQYGERLRVTNYINHYDRYGRLIKGYSVKDVDCVDIDNKGNVWILDSKGLKKLENDKFVDKNPMPVHMKRIDVDNFGNILVSGENEIFIIKGDYTENFKIDAFVRNNAYVTKDSLDNIKFISRDSYKYYNLMMTSLNKDGSLKSSAASILLDSSDTQQITEDAVNGTYKFVEGENINDKFINSYKTAKIYYDETYVFARDSELFQIKGANARLYGNLTGKVYAIEVKDNDNKPQLYAVSKEIKQDGNEIINIFLTSLGEEENDESSGEDDSGIAPIPIGGGPLSKDNKKYYNLKKFLMDKNGILFIDVEEIGTGIDNLFRKVDDMENAREDIVAVNNSESYASVFINENGSIEYVMKSGINDTYEVYKVTLTKNYFSMRLDTRFEDQDEALMKQYDKIQNLIEAYDGTLFMLVNNKVYSKKSGDSLFKPVSEIKNANSLVVDKNGRVFIGTDGYGVACYMHPNSESADTSHPGVAYMNISKYSKQVPEDSSIEIMFNENLKESANYDKIALKDKYGNIVPFSFWLNGSILTLKPDRLLDRSTLYTVTIPYNSLTDMGQRAFNNDYTFNFTTAGETIPPTIIKAQVDKKNNSVNITFSEEIEKGSTYGKIIFTDINGKSVRFTSSITGNTLTIKYTDKLSSKVRYRVSIPGQCVNDLEGNKLAKGYDLYFVYQ